MPIALGVMQINRINIYNTSTTLSILPESVAYCADLVNLSVIVQNTRLTGPNPTGTVIIKDTNTNTTLGSGSLSPNEGLPYESFYNLDIVMPFVGTYNIVAYYQGVTNLFIASNSNLSNIYYVFDC